MLIRAIFKSQVFLAMDALSCILEPSPHAALVRRIIYSNHWKKWNQNGSLVELSGKNGSPFLHCFKVVKTKGGAVNLCLQK